MSEMHDLAGLSAAIQKVRTLKRGSAMTQQIDLVCDAAVKHMVAMEDVQNLMRYRATKGSPIRTSIRLLTGASSAELDDLGGFSDDDIEEGSHG